MEFMSNADHLIICAEKLVDELQELIASVKEGRDNTYTPYKYSMHSIDSSLHTFNDSLLVFHKDNDGQNAWRKP
jgi:hypothetical protein